MKGVMDMEKNFITPAPLDLPPMGMWDRIRESARLTRRILWTGEHPIAQALADGMDVGMDGGFAAALGEFNAALVAQGIDPIRDPQ